MENVVTLETVRYDVSPQQDLSEPLLPPGPEWNFKAVLELQTFSHVGLTTELPLFVFQLHMGLMFTEPTLKKPSLNEWMNFCVLLSTVHEHVFHLSFCKMFQAAGSMRL